MIKDKFVFAQLVSFLNRSKFNRIVEKYDGDKYAKHFTCWNQLLTLMFGQLCNRESLRDLTAVLDAHKPKCRHLGMGKWAKFRKAKGGIKVHTLYDVETQIHAFFHITNAAAHDSKAMSKIPHETGSYYIFDRAYNNFKALKKIKQIDACFVVRAKNNLQYKIVRWKQRLHKKCVI